MSESVEQAALRRAEREAAIETLPAPFGQILAAIDAGEQLNSARFRHVTQLQDEIDRCHAQLAEQGDAILALSNRIEGLTRSSRFPERPCPRFAVIHGPHIYERGSDAFVCPGVSA